MIRDDTIYTVSALAQLLGQSEEWLWEHVLNQQLPITKVGGVTFIPGRFLHSWIERRAKYDTKTQGNERCAKVT